ncbi:MauE/DoxX family redox-associated membrane protein [Plantactinospora sp. WMMB334]|uniref:MauE/DoxX family redox-associated membrane protein n=1 Tax=Plantactinospora sp. WMMB334 TaxID=3404119 RepID=UPI003B938A4A
MLQLLAALQPLLVGVVLIWSARIKLLDRRAAGQARRSALGTLVGEERAVPAYRLLGGVELLLGILLVLPPAPVAEPLAAAGLATGFVGYLWYARRAAPGASCGCLSARATPVTGRSIGRAGLLVLAGLAGAAAGGAHWLPVLLDRPVGAVGVLLAEAAVVVALSPEFDSAWLLPLRRLRVRLTSPLRGGSGVPLLASVQQLQLSAAYRQVAALLTSDVREHWLEDPWRMVCYSARYQGRPATAVFAVPAAEVAPERVRVAVVDDSTGATLVSLAGERAYAT